MEFTAGVLAKTEDEFRSQVDRVRNLGLNLHVDVMDGNFLPYVSWADPTLVPEIAGDLGFEAHLMVNDPEHTTIVWLAAGAVRVWVHAESTHRETMIMRSSSPEDAARIGLVINPETPISEITPLIDQVEAVMIMGVTPGKSGQAFQEIALEKIRQLKQMRPHLWVKVDGGVGPDTIRSIAEAGADAVTSTTALTAQNSPEKALVYLQALAAGHNPTNPNALQPESKPTEAAIAPDPTSETGASEEARQFLESQGSDLQGQKPAGEKPAAEGDSTESQTEKPPDKPADDPTPQPQNDEERQL